MRVFVRSLEPEWAAAATEVKEQTKGKVKLAAVDATANQMLTGRYGVCLSGSPCEITPFTVALPRTPGLHVRQEGLFSLL